MKKINTTKASKSIKSATDISSDSGVLSANDSDVQVQGTEESPEESFEGTEGDEFEGELEGEGAPAEETPAPTDPEMVPSATLNEATGHTIPLPLEGQTVYITKKAFLAIMATEAAKSVKKELSSQTKDMRDDAKKNAQIAREGKFSNLNEVGAELGLTVDVLKKAGMSQFLMGEKKTMTLVGASYGSPLGKGGARYYVNHGKGMTLTEKANRIELAKRVALAASIAAQKAGMEAMIKFAPIYGVKIAGFVAEEKKADA